MRVEVVRSPRRRKTVQAREVDGVLRVSIPATMTRADEERWVAEMVRRMQRRSASSSIDLAGRAALLADRYGLQHPAAIRWAANQQWRWGSCTPADRSVRISSRLAGEPGWVLDYVIVHELAHLDVPRHGPAFWALVARYPLAERARGFLIARALQHGTGAGDAPPADGGGFDDDAEAACAPDDPSAAPLVQERAGPASSRRRNRRGPATV